MQDTKRALNDLIPGPEARVAIRCAAVGGGAKVEVVAVDGGEERSLAQLDNGEGWILPVGQGGREILLRIRGV